MKNFIKLLAAVLIVSCSQGKKEEQGIWVISATAGNEITKINTYWKNMLIVITEDDAQNGVDYIDAHRSALMLVSPWIKRDYVSHVHNSFGSLFKTFWNVLDLPYLNQCDAGATDLSGFFTNTPDYKPYNAVEVDPRVFNPQKALDHLMKHLIGKV
ncbi:hypothetical protein [Confluentibacter sediminis]|uniref:hypothetical protein n=1 Tax=Confluentibacter sediminis TaxID=2219045 RepID=UPI000DAC4211|nr:hypothetical protein [Confluentibacter sediminis]